MSNAVKQIPTEDLAVGMYVSRLDRPWLETPFLFQGFTIKSPEEIKQIQRFCRHVFVEQTAVSSKGLPGSTKPRDSKSGEKEKRPWRDRFSWLFPRVWNRLGDRSKEEAAPGDFYSDAVTLVEELPEAKQILTNASSLLIETMEAIRKGGKLDVQVLESAVNPMMESLLRNRDAMTWLSRIKRTDDYTYGHSVSCAIYAIAFGRHLGLSKDDLKTLGLGGLLLDVGKTKIPKELLCKLGTLSNSEVQLMRRHVEFGEEILSEVDGMDRQVIEMVRFHHERYEGSGYPYGLKGPDIPVFARIAGIVDFFDAMTTPRPYAGPISAYDAMRELHNRLDTEFQSEMVEHFVRAIGMFPNGALVELSTGEVGIVVDQNRVRRLRPKIMVVLGADKKPMDEFVTVDLRELPSEMGDSGAVWIDRGLEAGAYGIDPARYFL
jgi:HD-GYP domain-containing protein (c-di-GMP phosphodiesterase class II)